VVLGDGVVGCLLGVSKNSLRYSINSLLISANQLRDVAHNFIRKQIESKMFGL
jgi:hypothetical protein